MPSPTTADLLAQLERWLPGHYRSARAITGGLAAQAALAAATAEDLEGSVSIGGAEGQFLSLLARGYGVNRASGETDDALRDRLRNIEQKVTPVAIVARANEILAAYTDDEVTLIEHFESGAFCDQSYCNQTAIFDQHNAFTILAPRLGDDDRVSDYADQCYAGQAFAGPGHTHVAYIALLAEIERIRPAGVRWWLKLYNAAEEEDTRVSFTETVHFGNMPADPQSVSVWVDEGYRLVAMGHRSTASPTAGDLSIVMDDDGVSTDCLEATPIDVTGDTVDTDIVDTGDLAVDTNTRTTPTGGAYFIVTLTDLDLGADTEDLAVHLTFDPVV